MVLNFDLRARYSVPTEYRAEFRSQSSLDIQYLPNTELNFDLGARHSVYLPNKELNFYIRDRYSVPTEYKAELLYQTFTFSTYRI